MLGEALEQIESKVLIIDDSSDYQMLVTHALRMVKVVPKTFSSALDAIKYVKQATVPPKLILTDLNMPEMGGDEFIRTMKADETLAEIKIILTSAGCDLPKLAREMGADGYLRKPFDISDLYALVKDL
jgi:two-component system chemotaxis response regulator CheY